LAVAPPCLLEADAAAVELVAQGGDAVLGEDRGVEVQAGGDELERDISTGRPRDIRWDSQ
jgi:hypothetical protein